MGWNIKNQYDILLKITNFLPIPKKFTVNKLEDFNTSIETRNIGINKNSQYLNWRYPRSDIFYQKFNILSVSFVNCICCEGLLSCNLFYNVFEFDYACDFDFS
jgi:hypothetical protein